MPAAVECRATIHAPMVEDEGDRLVSIGPLVACRGEGGRPLDYHFDVLYIDGETERMTWLRAPDKGLKVDRPAKSDAAFQRNLMVRDHRENGATIVLLHDLVSFDSMVRLVRRSQEYKGPAEPSVLIMNR